MRTRAIVCRGNHNPIAPMPLRIPLQISHQQAANASAAQRLAHYQRCDKRPGSVCVDRGVDMDRTHATKNAVAICYRHLIVRPAQHVIQAAVDCGRAARVAEFAKKRGKIRGIGKLCGTNHVFTKLAFEMIEVWYAVDASGQPEGVQNETTHKVGTGGARVTCQWNSRART